MAKGKQTIWVGPADGSNHKPLNVEGIAGLVIAPGSSVVSVGAGLTLATTANKDFSKTFLVADKDQQRSKTVNDDWAAGENVVAIQPRSGEFFNALVITSQAITVGDALAVSSTAGGLKLAASDGSDDVVAYADETITTTATQLVRCVKA